MSRAEYTIKCFPTNDWAYSNTANLKRGVEAVILAFKKSCFTTIFPLAVHSPDTINQLMGYNSQLPVIN